MADWPSTLPQYLDVDGFSNTFQKGTIRSSIDAGPPKVRRRFSATTENITGSITIDKTQYSTLIDFYKNTLYEGTLTFTWIHPITGNTVSMRFVQPPEIAPMNSLYFKATLTLEILP